MFGKKKTLALALLIFMGSGFSGQVHGQSKLAIKGRVVMFDSMPRGMDMPFVGVFQTSIVEVLTVRRGRERSKFIILVGGAIEGQNFNPGNSDGKEFEFLMQRTRSCDSTIEAMGGMTATSLDGKVFRRVPRHIVSISFTGKPIPPKKRLPCYRFTGFSL